MTCIVDGCDNGEVGRRKELRVGFFWFGLPLFFLPGVSRFGVRADR